MEVYDLKSMKREESVCSPLSIALGNFDGVHAGHRELICTAVRYAQKNGYASAVWTFSDEAGVLPNKPEVKCITTTREKLELIADLGVDYAILEDFEKIRNMTPENFVQDLLKKELNTGCAVCGYNFRFGAGGVGTADTLKALMSPLDCIVIPQYLVDCEPVSSTVVRKLVENGDMESAKKLLGHPFFIYASVVHGKQLGRTIGIPTINQNFPAGHVVPMKGIYACTVRADGKDYPGVANVGVRPTIIDDSHRINCETHIIGYDGWLYGKDVRVSFYKRLRDEMRFEDINALQEQIKKDIQNTVEYFNNR